MIGVLRAYEIKKWQLCKLQMSVVVQDDGLGAVKGHVSSWLSCSSPGDKS